MIKKPYPPAPFERNYALFLDVDGTLADFHEDPAKVALSSSVLRVLDALHHQLNGAVALVSGRPIVDLTRMLEGQPLCCIGLHGLTQNDHCPVALNVLEDPNVLEDLDVLERSSVLEAANVPKASREMAELRRQSFNFSQQHPQVMVEDKQFGLALHYRSSPQSKAAVLQFAHEYLQRQEGRSDFALLEGKMVVEFRPSGINKGVAIQRLLDQVPFEGRTPLFIGDDVTDEAGFAAVNAAQGVSIKCGEGPSCAQFRLPDVVSVHEWLENYLGFLAELNGR